MSAVDAVKLGYFIKNGHDVRGVIHVGANDGEEITYYKELGLPVVAFEPLPAAFERLTNAHPDVLAYEVGWGARDEMVYINITENDKASSVLPTWPVRDPGAHPVYKDWTQGQWPVIDRQMIRMVKFEEFVDSHELDLTPYNALVMDVQGMELEALYGMGNRIDDFDYLVIELSKEPVYQGEAPADFICSWLVDQGFVQLTPIELHDDVLFIRKEVMHA